MADETKSQDNLMGALAYLFGWVTGVILWFTMAKSSKFIRFHAMQSIIFSVVLMVIFFVLGLIPFIGWIISGLLGLATFIAWIYLMFKAYQGQMYKLPFIGAYADKWSA
jgi:uncharacterized membrane protein